MQQDPSLEPLLSLPSSSTNEMDHEKDDFTVRPISGETSSTALPVQTESVISDGNVDPVYAAKAQRLNDALQEIGFGAYQKFLFVVAGFGWFVDNLWPQVTAIIVPAIVNEFQLDSPRKKTYLTLSQNIGLLVGAAGWGLGSDIIGRRWAFNLTLLITGVFGLVAGASPNFASVCIFAALWSSGVGGSLPVDSAIFLEFIPGSHQYLLTVLSIWWAFGQIVASLVAWPLMANYACLTMEDCKKSNNYGWRYFVFAMGGLTLVLFIVRFFVFTMYESPKYKMGKGKDEQAVEIIHKIAAYNKVHSSLTIEHMRDIDRQFNISPVEASYTSNAAAIKRSLEKFRFEHVRALFRTKELAYSTSLIIAIWGIIGLAFPLYNAFLPFLLESRGAELGDSSVSTIYRNYVIIGICGIPGSLIGGFAVELPKIGRKGAMSIATILTGVFLYLSTTAKTSNALLAWNCAYSITSNTMYAVVYAYTPEVFVTSSRGTGNGLAATANRIFGVMAPIIAGSANLTTSIPVYISGALFCLAGVIMILLPYEPRGKASL